ncbi:hypothetical protein LJR074_002191 [Acidovorax sp. LjRoot74]|uniref:hypothetical protein n=1 Tax=Acidovorax sp. LjRoot74 TaxID=3342337 RepID=UPI003ED0CC2E
MAYKPPRTLAESEELLRGHAKSEATNDAWRSFGGLLVFILALAGIGLVTFMSVSVTLVAWIVGIVGVAYATGAIASAGRK